MILIVVHQKTLLYPEVEFIQCKDEAVVQPHSKEVLVSSY